MREILEKRIEAHKAELSAALDAFDRISKSNGGVKGSEFEFAHVLKVARIRGKILEDRELLEVLENEA